MKMTKAQARRRLKEAQAKFIKVMLYGGQGVIKVADMEAIDRIVKRAEQRLK